MGAYVDFCSDLRETGIMFATRSESTLQDFEDQEDVEPSPCKVLCDRKIYQSRKLNSQDFGIPILCDLGGARYLGLNTQDDHRECRQNLAPEVLFGMDWDYKVDIWMVGMLVTLSLSLRVCVLDCVMDC